MATAWLGMVNGWRLRLGEATGAGLASDSMGTGFTSGAGTLIGLEAGHAASQNSGEDNWRAKNFFYFIFLIFMYI
jgi:hypothetical protein